MQARGEGREASEKKMPTPITKKGYEALKADLDRLRNVQNLEHLPEDADMRALGSW